MLRASFFLLIWFFRLKNQLNLLFRFLFSSNALCNNRIFLILSLLISFNWLNDFKQSRIFLISSKGCELHSIGLQKAPKSIYKRQSFYQWRQRSSRVQWNRKLDWGVSNYNFSIIMAWGLDSKLLLCFYCMLPCIFFFGPSFASVLQWFSFLEVRGTVITNMIFTHQNKPLHFQSVCFFVTVCMFVVVVNFVVVAFTELCHQHSIIYT